MYGITVNTSYKVPAHHPHRSGDYGMVYPAPGKSYATLEEAEAQFDELVRSHKVRKLGFCATLNEYRDTEIETIRREDYTGNPAKEALYS